MIDPVLTGNKKVFYFTRPEEEITFLAFDDALALKITWENKFYSLGDKISAVSENRITNFDKISSIKFPLCLVGELNSAPEKNADEWKDFADNDWFIPRFLFSKRVRIIGLFLIFLSIKIIPQKIRLIVFWNQLIN